MILGAIIAGGQSRRFGRDKALEPVHGTTLLGHVIAALMPQVDRLIICGRKWPELSCIEDRPAPDMGPLGGINAALYFAQQNGFNAVITAGCDTMPVPENLAEILHNTPEGRPTGAVIENQPLFALWPPSLAPSLNNYLITRSDRSLRGWIAYCSAETIVTDMQFHNINTQADFTLYCRTQGCSQEQVA